MKNDFQSRSGSASEDRAAGQTASDLQPLGITARAGATVAIYAELPDDATVYVVPTQYYGESGVWKGTPVALKNGRNYITVQKIGSLSDTRGGMLYLTYAGSNPEDIKLQVRVLSNAWEMPVLELSNWYSMGQSARKDAIRAYVQELEAYVSGLTGANYKTDVRNATEISTPSVLLSLPADQVLAGLKGVGNDESAMVEAMYQNVLAWEEELFVANQVQGIIDSSTALSSYQYPMTTRQNIRYMRMFVGAFMYAAGNHIGVEYGSTSALVQGKPTSVTGAGSANGLFGWGIAHEIGHNIDKLGKAEITNNIYSLALQAWDGSSMSLNTRLTEDGRWADIFNKVAQGRPGTATVTASVEESQVTLTIQHTDASKILGYEIRRNGVAIAFTTGSTYTDNLGAANNRTYTYSVVPVDKLGNLGAEAKANEVRVAYDKTISDDLYTLEHDGDTVTITMKNGASVPVTGIKVTGTGLSGSYTVQVKASAGANWTDAKTGELSDNLVAYFTKPGAKPDDTRIWTYDAAVVKITGIPESAQVELLDYPGDRVDFYEGAAVGVLKDNFQYGDREDEVIPAGTLVILGTYRGDPTYNYVSVEAVYNTTSEADEANGVTTITREQMAATLYQYARLQGKLDSGRADLSIFADVDDLSAYAREPMSWAVAQGLFSGVSADTLAPGGSTTRAQAAVILTAFSKALG